MTLNEWLSQKPGRAKAMAQHFNVTEAAVSQWRKQAPRRLINELHAYTKRQVSVLELLAKHEKAPAPTEAA